MNGLRRADRKAAESVGTADARRGRFPRRSQVGADGHPTRYPSGRVWMVRESERTYNVNLGGIAEAAAFVPCVGQGLFCISYPFRFGEAERPSAA